MTSVEGQGPFLVTVTRPCGGCGGSVAAPCALCEGEPVLVSRRAFETLDGDGQARAAAIAEIHAAYGRAYPILPRGRGGEHSDAQRAHRWHVIEAQRLPAEGGTVGPLPDGSTITVEKTTWEQVEAAIVSRDSSARGRSIPSLPAAMWSASGKQAALRVFNASSENGGAR